jgi:hypothetical protein
MSRTSAASVIAIWIVVATSIVLRGAGVPGAPIIPGLSAMPAFSVSTVPSNGDVNPYGVAFVPDGFPPGGLIAQGDILVSNFNASSNLQGTGTTIVRIDPNGGQSLFFQGRNLGLTTALGVLKSGFVLVGNVPTTTPAATCTEAPSGVEHGVEQGSLLILDRQGHLVSILKNHQFLDGPWDLTINDSGTTAQVFVSNALSATVTRLDFRINPGGQLALVQATQIASGYAHRCDPAALVVGPTGLALDPASGTLFVASTGDNEVYAVPNAMTATSDQGTGTIFIHDTTHLHGPLALALAPNGDLITAQGDAVNPDSIQPSEIVEYTAAGTFVAQRPINAAPGSAFGLALGSSGGSLRFAAVDDGLNVLDIWIVSPE